MGGILRKINYPGYLPQYENRPRLKFFLTNQAVCILQLIYVHSHFSLMWCPFKVSPFPRKNQSAPPVKNLEFLLYYTLTGDKPTVVISISIGRDGIWVVNGTIAKVTGTDDV